MSDLFVTMKAQRPAWYRFKARRKYDFRKQLLENHANWWYENGGREQVRSAARDFFLYGIKPEGFDTDV